MRHKSQRGLFEEKDRLEKLSRQKDPLVKLKSLINWEQFRPVIN